MHVQGIIKKVNTPSRMRKYYCGVLRRFLSQNIVAITGTLRLNRFNLLYVFLKLTGFSQLLRCEVALHFINT